VPIEPVDSKTATLVLTSANLGMVAQHHDYTGRTVNKIIQIVPSIANAPAARFTAVDHWEDACIPRHVNSDTLAEHVDSLLSQAALGRVRTAEILMPVHQLGDVLVPGTLSPFSQSLGISRVIRNARTARGHDRHTDWLRGGTVLFRGTVGATKLDDIEDYRDEIGNHRIDGPHDDQGLTRSTSVLNSATNLLRSTTKTRSIGKILTGHLQELDA
jgi:hypothetical protein